MSETKHSPGPWDIRKRSYDSVVAIWTIEIHAPRGFAFFIGRECEDREDHEELIANAALISAAPELLEALEACLPFVKAREIGHPTAEIERAIHRAAAALKKAKGDL